MSTFVKIAITSLLCLQIIGAQEFGSLIRNCRQKHIERLNECVVGAVKSMQSRMAKGIPELGIPRLEPLVLEGFNLSQDQGPVAFKANFDNISVTGVSRFDLKYLDVNHNDQTVRLGCVVPGINIRGVYDIQGRVFQLPVEGSGPFLALLEGVVAEGTGFITYGNDGKLQMNKMTFDFKIQKFRSKVENLFGGNSVLQDTFSHFMQENSNLVLEEVRPGLVNNMDTFLTQVINVILAELPDDIMVGLPNTNALDKHRARTVRVAAAAANAQS